MKKLITGTAVLAMLTGMVFAAADDSITARQTAMKAVGKAAKAGDFAAINEAATAAKAAFMVDTTGQGSIETTALDAIWTDKAKFDGLLDKLISASAAGDKDGTFGTCKSCHTAFRVKK